MKYKFLIIPVLAILLFSSCGSSNSCSTAQTDSLLSEKISLADFVYKSGNIITKKQFPYLVHAKDIYYDKDSYLLIDIRDKKEYAKGHIDGAYNVQPPEIMTFLKDSVNPAAYEKIAIIDSYGPQATYIATLLRFDGYNAYGLKFGIASWNRSFKSNIVRFLSNKYGNRLDNKDYPKPAKGSLPEVAGENAFDVLDARVKGLISEPVENYIISPDEVFANLDKYYIVAYWSEAKYKEAHIPGSVRYQPRVDLSLDKDLTTLPKDKKIIVYCNTGHHAIAAVAYLRLLGYDAASMMYGVNSFMNLRFKQFAPASAITTQNVDLICGDFPLLKGDKRTSDKPAAVKQVSNTPPPAVVPVKKKKTESVGGCE